MSIIVVVCTFRTPEASDKVYSKDHSMKTDVLHLLAECNEELNKQ